MPALSPIFILLSANRLSVIHNKDLLATIHLLVAMVKRFQPELNLPPNVKVEVVVVEVSSTLICTSAFLPFSFNTRFPMKLILFHLHLQVSASGIKSHTETEVLTDDGWAQYCSVPRRCSFEKAHAACWLFEQKRRLQRPRQRSEWVKKFPAFDMLTISSAKMQPEMTFPAAHFPQRTIPSTNCWSWSLTRSTRWSRYNKERNSL